MSGIGIRAAIDHLAKGVEGHRNLADRLKALKDGSAPAEEFIPLLRECEAKGVLSSSVVACLIIDLAEVESWEAADIEAGAEEKDEECVPLSHELEVRIDETIREFLAKHPLPKMYVCDALENVAEDLSRHHQFAPPHCQRLADAKNRILPGKLFSLGERELARLLSQDPEEFKRRKQTGERALTGRTYDEMSDECFNKHFGYLFSASNSVRARLPDR